MSKVVKLKQSDIERIVENIMKENEFDDFDTQIQPEEVGDELTLAQNPKTGEFFVLKNATTENPEIVARTK